MNLLAMAWRGQERLWRAYWLLGIPFSLLGAIYAIGFSRGSEHHILILGFSLLLTAILVFWSVAVWRCSNNVESKFWGLAARVVVVVNLAAFALEWFKAFA